MLFRKLFKFFLFCAIFAVLGLMALFAYFAKDLPDPTKMDQRQIIESTKIFDRTGQVILYDIHAEEKRTVIAFEEIPLSVRNATIVAEDDNFYHHIGLDWQGILRAAWADLRGKKVSQGGSTITQQYIKNAYLGGPQAERTVPRKIKEAILALELEIKYSKDQILGFYLNQVPYGSNAYGIEAASQTFFNKPAKELTLAEATLLAALPKAPSYYSPSGSHPEELKARQEYILDRLNKFGYIAQSEADQSKQEKLTFAGQAELKAHHFVTMIKEYLEEKYSQTYGDINIAGLKVYTTLDWDLQELAEQVVTDGVAKNENKYQASNAALVAVAPKTGQILALVGSKKYEEDQYNVATSPNRQPGSSFKPFVYATAFRKGFTPETIVFDLSTSFGKFGPAGQEQEYRPHDYDMKTRGPVSLRQALAQSLNIPSVKVLYLAGINEAINLAQDMGITTLKDRNRYQLSLVLGGGEIKLLDEAAAFGVFATEGIKHPVSMILKIEDNQGKVLEEFQDKPIRVLEEQVARQINSILSDEEARAPMFGKHSKLYLGDRPAAVKTGTTQDYTDGWTVGYTPSLSVGVWAGNNDFNKKMRPGADGVYVAAPMWNEFMTKAYQIKQIKKEKSNEAAIENQFSFPEQVESFNPPQPNASSTKPMLNGQLAYQKKVKIDKISGKLATDLTPPDLIEEKIYQQVHTILYYVDKNNPLADFPADPTQNSQFFNWEEPVLQWASQQSCSQGVCYNQNPTSQYDDVHTLENQPKVKITSPLQGDSVSQSILTVQVQASAPLDIKQVDFFFNDQLISSDTLAPYSATFNITPYLTGSSEQTIKVRAYDTVLNRKEDAISVYYNH